jgi:hypothetical protein
MMPLTFTTFTNCLTTDTLRSPMTSEAESIIPNAVYCQSANRRNISRLLVSFLQANIPYRLVGASMHCELENLRSDVVTIILKPEDYEKFQRIFVQQRLAAIANEYGRCFWDMRTGLTLRIILTSD